MRIILLRAASVIGVAGIFLAAFLWLTRSPPENVIPVAFQGTWLDPGAECGDTQAQVAITSTTIDADSLTFKADGLSAAGPDLVTLTGEAFPNGQAKRTHVTLQMRDHRRELLILEPNRKRGLFTRCVPDTEEH